MMDQLSEELGFRFIRCGKVLVGNTPEDMENPKENLETGGRTMFRGTCDY